MTIPGYQFRESFCNLCTEKCENNATENSDTFDGLSSDSVLTVVLLNASNKVRQRSFRLKHLSMT